MFDSRKLTTRTTYDKSLSPSIKWHKTFCLIFKRSCLKLIHELDTWSGDLSCDFTLADCLIGGFKLAKSAYRDKCVYTGYGIGFNTP